MSRTVDEEIAIMRRRWPGFRVTAAGDALVCWRGFLAPIRRPYEIRILYGPGRMLGRCWLENRHPRVEVISPLLGERHPTTDEAVPHLYENPGNPDSPLLCLFDAANDEWEPGSAIADTIVPWTSHWLACYEGWLATGVWTGGGRHPGKAAEGSLDRTVQTPGRIDTAWVRKLAARITDVFGTYTARAILAHAASSTRDAFDTVERHYLYQAVVRHSSAKAPLKHPQAADPITPERDAA